MAVPSWKNIDFSELIESGTIENYDATGGDKLSRVFRVASADRFTFVSNVFGGASDGFGPIRYPNLQARAKTVSFTPFPPHDHNTNTPTVISDIESQIYLHNYVKATVNYETIQAETQDDSDLPDGTYATYRMNWTGEFIEIPGRTMKWEGTNIKVKDDAKATKVVPRTQHIVTWNRVTDPPWHAISGTRGMVNKEKWRIPATRQIMGPHTLLFMGAEPEITYTTEDQAYWSLQYTFEEKSVTGLETPDNWQPPSTDPMEPPPEELVFYGWNHIWRDDVGKWWRPTTFNGTGDGTDLMHQEIEFEPLFQFQIYPV